MSADNAADAFLHSAELNGGDYRLCGGRDTAGRLRPDRHTRLQPVHIFSPVPPLAQKQADISL